MRLRLALHALDSHLLDPPPLVLTGLRRFALEFLYFGIKQARACLFAGLFFVAIFLVPRTGLAGLPRYDVLLVIALAIQALMLWARLETWDEFKAICLLARSDLTTLPAHVQKSAG